MDKKEEEEKEESESEDYDSEDESESDVEDLFGWDEGLDEEEMHPIELDSELFYGLVLDGDSNSVLGM